MAAVVPAELQAFREHRHLLCSPQQQPVCFLQRPQCWEQLAATQAGGRKLREYWFFTGDQKHSLSVALTTQPQTEEQSPVVSELGLLPAPPQGLTIRPRLVSSSLDHPLPSAAQTPLLIHPAAGHAEASLTGIKPFAAQR